VLFAVVVLAVWISSPRLAAVSPWILALLVLGIFLIYYGYFAAFEAIWNGQTPGKRIIGLRVIHASGRPVSVFEAVLRNVVRLVDQLPGIYAVGIVTVFLTERSQRLGDVAAGTVVVHERNVQAQSQQFLGQTPPTPTVRRYGASRLTAGEMAVIDLYFRRRDSLDGLARVRVASQIASRIRERLEITGEIDNEQLLEEVRSEYRARGRFR
jgi:uncharacterized RDD family membrane protein YckC